MKETTTNQLLGDQFITSEQLQSVDIEQPPTMASQLQTISHRRHNTTGLIVVGAFTVLIVIISQIFISPPPG